MKRLTQALITLYLVLSVCVPVCVRICVFMCERVKGPMCLLILNIDTLVGELHPLTLYPPPREEEVRREETGEVKEGKVRGESRRAEVNWRNERGEETEGKVCGTQRRREKGSKIGGEELGSRGSCEEDNVWLVCLVKN